MDSSKVFLLAADVILLLHVLFVIFVVLGMVLVFIGNIRSWSWVLNPWFRLTHLAAIAVVVVQSWLGLICPLTTIEMTLRSRAGDNVYSDSFIAHWLESILYYQLQPWVFVVCYTAFAAVVVASWFWVRPRGF
ncbi:MAG: DUF2784 domain-containing protein [Proteobacteria bacterium]|nr:DUF2784 domain-containing protein [Pseudomonadota bacterium]